MKKNRSRVVVMVALLACLLYCGLFSADNCAHAAVSGDQSKVYVIKVTNDGTLTNPKVMALLKWSKDVAQDTKGKVKIEVYYGGQLYNDRDAINAVSMGNVDVALPPFPVISGVDANSQIFDLPSFYGMNYAQYRMLIDGQVGKTLARMFEKKLKVKVIGYYFLGNYIYASNSKPIRAPEDFSGQRIRIQGGPISETNMKTIGGAPVVVPWTECYPSLQQKVIDGIETTMVGFNSIRGWEVTKYLTYSKHIKNAYMFMMNKKKYDSIPSDLMSIVLKRWTESRVYQDETAVVEKEAEGVKNFTNNGVKVFDMTNNELAAIRSKILPLEDKYISDLKLDRDFVVSARNALK